MKSISWISWIFAGSLLVAASGCRQQDAPEPPPPTVTVIPVQEREIQDFAIITGRTDAIESVDIRARVSGYLTETKFQDGQEVKKGDVLFLIDPRPYQADLDRATASYNSAQADLKLAEIEFNRTKELREKNAVSAQDFDTKSAALLKAQATLAGSRAAYDTAKLSLDFTRITAPIDGQTSKASVTPGNLITPDMTAPLTNIVSTEKIYAYADLDERQLLRYVRLNNTAQDEGTHPHKPSSIQLQLADEKDFPHEGVIDFADNRVSTDTGTISIRGIFDDKSNLLGPGMFVRLRFPAGKKYQALLVPQEAIGTDQGQKFVYIVKPDGTVDYRRVDPGTLQDDGWRAVKGRIQAGEKVVVEGLMKARQGEKVTVSPWSGGTLPATSEVAVPEPEAKP
ncbi:MAG: efflux RND transporter periplasmic adaptor subunit [Verrucomicrobiae bacterium]